ncbi:hypothetical protein [Amycolatopsis cihanbeyliensis]|uniref:Uncharacterized protein n=1 Tax=Amycolatopsis cihanbeyliensis TaxID=1128664 RepID=A0A542DP10_AMYCI|nr:hypothetical protein [Amycolatopsis cihanbeyliensis]TQJ04797.1 hypothetical protein FB471_4606 [Amycolatopsis cihanbeyliensis]
MDPRDRADALLSRARARNGVVTPDNMTSPMDASNTQQIPGSFVRDIDRSQDPDTTTKLPASVIEENDYLAREEPTSSLDPVGSQPTTPLTRRAAEPTAEPAEEAVQPRQQEPAEQEHDGLIPTTRTQRGQSALSRRLEGL